MAKPVPRSRDDQVLQWVAWRCAGISLNAIASASGKASGAVSIATNDIRDADIAESGEPDAAKFYW